MDWTNIYIEKNTVPGEEEEKAAAAAAIAEERIFLENIKIWKQNKIEKEKDGAGWRRWREGGAPSPGHTKYTRLGKFSLILIVQSQSASKNASTVNSTIKIKIYYKQRKKNKFIWKTGRRGEGQRRPAAKNALLVFR